MSPSIEFSVCAYGSRILSIVSYTKAWLFNTAIGCERHSNKAARTRTVQSDLRQIDQLSLKRL
jgi:hypothetical protein